jgi:hypothetical protein
MPAPNNPARPSLQARILAEQEAARAQDTSTPAPGVKLPSSEPVPTEAPNTPASPPASMLNPSPSQDPNAEKREAGFSAEQTAHFIDLMNGANGGEYPPADPQIVDTLIEALMGWRASLHGALARINNSPSLNPAADNEVRRVVKQGISRAEDLAVALAPLGTQAQRAAKTPA